MSNNLSIFSKNDWGKYYPAESYASWKTFVANGNKLPTDCKNESEALKTIVRVRSNLFHFYLATDESPTVVLQEIDKIAQQFKDTKEITHIKLLSKADEAAFNLTPLHIAVMQGKKEVVFACLAIFTAQAVKSVRDVLRGCMNARDAYGWTPLHHAALLSPVDPALSKELIDRLKASGADADAVTSLKATHEQIEQLVTKKVDFTPFKKIQCDGVPLTQEKIAQAFNNVEFCNTVYFPPEYRTALWTQTPEEEDPLESILIRNSLKLPLKRFDINEVKLDGQVQKGFYGLFAGEDLPAGTVIGMYTGSYVPEKFLGGFQARFTPQARQDAAYLFGFDAQRMRNHTASANHGFPTAIAFSIPVPGVATVPYLFVAEKTAAGEQLFIDYGADHNTNFDPQILFGKENMEQFFKPGLDAIWESLRPLEVEAQKLLRISAKDHHKLNMAANSAYIQRTLIKSRILYVLGNPKAMLYLHFSNIIPLEHWKEVVNWNTPASTKPYFPMIERWGTARPLHYFNLIRLVMALHNLDREIHTKKPGDYPFFQKWVLSQLESLSMMDLSKAIEWMGIELLNDDKTESNETIAQKISERLKTYDWMQDPMNFYGIEARRLSYHEHFDYKTQCTLDLRKLPNTPYLFYKTKAEIIALSLGNLDEDDLTDESTVLVVEVMKSAEKRALEEEALL